MLEIFYWCVVYLCTGILLVVVSRFFSLLNNWEGLSWTTFRGELHGGDIPLMVLLVAVWPLIALFLLVDLLFSRVNVFLRGADPHRFQCQREHLLLRVSVSQAEAGAFVNDPLGRTPTVPFGHLNAGWQSFVAKQQQGLQLWSFEVPGVMSESRRSNRIRWSIPRGRKAGYVWATKWNRIEHEFTAESD